MLVLLCIFFTNLCAHLFIYKTFHFNSCFSSNIYVNLSFSFAPFPAHSEIQNNLNVSARVAVAVQAMGWYICCAKQRK